MWGTSPFDEMLEKATSELRLAGDEDIALNLEICDQIRTKTVLPKSAMQSIKERLNHQNSSVQLLTLSLLDMCVKNGGGYFLLEIASRDFMDNFTSILKLPALNRKVQERMLELVQIWAVGFEGKSSLSYVTMVYKTLKREGFTFPPKDAVAANLIMVDTPTAPDWMDSDWCMRCRTPFTFRNRKHHCRNCGQAFDQACSSETLPLPHRGIVEPVRVCDSCFIELKMKNVPKNLEDTTVRRSQSQSRPGAKPKSAREQADEDLQHAIEESTPTAPDWMDSDWCMRCRTPFTFSNRKHHCRNCCQVFDQACSSKTLPLPHFGIVEPVRVCDSCFIKLKMKNVPKSLEDTTVRRSQSQLRPGAKSKSAREQADEDLQRAIEESTRRPTTPRLPRPLAIHDRPIPPLAPMEVLTARAAVPIPPKVNGDDFTSPDSN
ncbi:Vacuolar protein-sorting-associated protein 27 [Tulasnella sp. UAMH 9824]|nr:Vacuolar protein-sorting-associated protein 27 [Tulasnella sp. UAMH 9824]